jgi:hypothetical protein
MVLSVWRLEGLMLDLYTLPHRSYQSTGLSESLFLGQST